MKAIALVLTFAAFVSPPPAQEKPAKPTPSQEIAKIVAVEEQERDLAKAETLYREALAGKELSAEARALATQRLGGLLYRLGRREEAVKLISDATPKGAVVTLDDVTAGLVQGGHDVEREKALREKARELVKQVLEQNGGAGPNNVLAGVADPRTAEQLMWLGAAAVPEVAGALAAELPRFPGEAQAFSVRKWPVAALAGFLWLVGDDAAATHLQSLVRDGKPEFRFTLYFNAYEFREPRMAQLAARFARDEADEDLVVLLLDSGNNLWARLDADAVVDLLVQKGPKVRTWLLSVLLGGQMKLRPDALAKVHGVVRQALQSSDPELGRTAQQFLLSSVSQASGEGVEMLLEELPKIRITHYQVAMMPPPAEWLRGTGNDRRLDPAIAARLWPRLLQCARTLGRNAQQGGNMRGSWLLGYMFSCARELDARIVPDVLTLVSVMPSRPAFNVFDLLRDKITVANAAQVFAIYGQLPDADSRGTLLDALERVSELPTELYEPLVQAAAAWEKEEPGKRERQFVRLLACTGNPDAAPLVLADWRAKRLERSDDAWLLVGLGRRTQAEPVRAAMREMAADSGVAAQHRSRLLLALLSMHDVDALDIVAAANDLPAARHPYAKKEPHPSSPGVSPMQYLLYENPDPPHGFTEDEVIAVLQKVAAPTDGLGAPQAFSVDAISDRALGVMATINRSSYSNGTISSSWPIVAMARLRARNGEGPLAAWFDQVLNRGEADVIELLDLAQIRLYRSRLERMLEGEPSEGAQNAANGARSAAMALLRAEPKVDLERLLTSKYAGVRSVALDHVVKGDGKVDEVAVLPLLRDPNSWIRVPAADYMGSIVSKAAVPDLITMLRDPDEKARAAAADALTRIRFYHEQQAHWDRVLKGMDASPASAAEKLLLQGKPGAPKEQRLLAITSLGTLGVPEALPFLIDWTQDADADIQKAAKDAITQIHLNPRK